MAVEAATRNASGSMVEQESPVGSVRQRYCESRWLDAAVIIVPNVNAKPHPNLVWIVQKVVLEPPVLGSIKEK
jgi:hypothetical protein